MKSIVAEQKPGFCTGLCVAAFLVVALSLPVGVQRTCAESEIKADGGHILMVDTKQPGQTDWDLVSQAFYQLEKNPALVGVTFSPRVYYFDDPKLSSSSQAHFLIGNISGKIIDGGGATFRFHFIRPGFTLVNCRELTIKNLTCEWDRPVAYPGIVESDGLLAKRVTLNKGYTTEGWIRVDAVSAYDWEKRSWPIDDAVRYHLKDPILGNNTVRSPDLWALTVGAKVIVRPVFFGGAHLFLIQDANDSGITLSHINVHNVPGMAFSCVGAGKGITLENCSLTLLPGEYVTAAADAAHFAGDGGGISIRDCDFGYQGDDGINLYGVWLQVTARNGDSEVVAMAPHAGPATPRAGAQMVLQDAGTLAILCTARIAKVTPSENHQMLQLEFTQPLPDSVQAGTLLGDPARACGDFHLEHNHIHDNRGCGIKVQTGPGTITDNVIERMNRAGVLLTASPKQWHEGFGVHDVMLARNTILVRNPAHSGIEVSSPELDHGVAIHHNIAIRDNQVNGTAHSAISVANAEGVQQSGNTFKQQVPLP